jgi:hypothetical protein
MLLLCLGFGVVWSAFLVHGVVDKVKRNRLRRLLATQPQRMGTGTGPSSQPLPPGGDATSPHPAPVGVTVEQPVPSAGQPTHPGVCAPGEAPGTGTCSTGSARGGIRTAVHTTVSKAGQHLSENPLFHARKLLGQGARLAGASSGVQSSGTRLAAGGPPSPPPPGASGSGSGSGSGTQARPVPSHTAAAADSTVAVTNPLQRARKMLGAGAGVSTRFALVVGGSGSGGGAAGFTTGPSGRRRSSGRAGVHSLGPGTLGAAATGGHRGGGGGGGASASSAAVAARRLGLGVGAGDSTASSEAAARSARAVRAANMQRGALSSQ